MNRFNLYLIIWLLALVQGYLLSGFSQAVIPNLMIVAVILIASRLPLRPAVILAGWGGWWLDVASNLHFGFRTLWMMGLAGLLSWFFKSGLEVNRGILMAVCALASLIYNLSLLIGLWLDSSELIWPWAVLPGWLVEAGLSSLVLAIAYNWVKSRYRLNLYQGVR